MKIAFVLAFVLACAFARAGTIYVGAQKVAIPKGWTQASVQEDGDRILLRSDDGRQQITISIMRFAREPSWEDFKRLCELRVQAEKKPREGIVVAAASPENENGLFRMEFHGEEASSKRTFFGYLSLEAEDMELLTFYHEGIDVDVVRQRDAFRKLLQGVCRG